MGFKTVKIRSHQLFYFERCDAIQMLTLKKKQVAKIRLLIYPLESCTDEVNIFFP